MQNLIPIEYQGQRILTTEQLAQAYETEPRRITENFQRNQEHFEPGKHYFYLQGEELKKFLQYAKGVVQNPSKVRSLYLWTERGANRHCKILDTDKAWEQFDYLEETYFRVKESKMMALPQNYAEALRQLADVWEQNQKLLPKAEAYDQFMDGSNYQKMNVVAKSLGIGRNKLFAFLRDQKILMSDNTPYQEYIDRGYFTVKQKPITMGDQTINMPITYVSPKGMEFIRRLLKEKSA